MVAYSEDLKVFTKKNLEPISSLKKKKKKTRHTMFMDYIEKTQCN